MEKPITVMTANVAGQEWMGFSKRKEAAYEVFRRTRADLVGFQELGLSNWNEVFGQARPDLKIAHGKPAGDIIINSFAYNPERFNLLGEDTMWLSPDGSESPGWDGSLRGATYGWFMDCEQKKEFIFINAHLDNIGKQARIESIRLILGWLKNHTMPVIFAADANASVHSPQMEMWGKPEMRLPYELMLDAGFVDCWTAAHPALRRPCTYHKFLGPKYDVFKDDGYGTYDTEWLMARGDIHVRDCSIITDEVNGIFPSDHFWMEAEVVLV